MTEDRLESLEELTALYAAGALSPQEREAFESRLAAGWPEAEALLAEHTHAIAALAEEVPAVPPGRDVKARLFAKLDETNPPRSGPRFGFGESTPFRPTPYPGVQIQLLFADRHVNRFAAILRMEPGSRLPSHVHDGAEECLVLKGEIIVGEQRLKPGDYQRAEPGSTHVDQWTETGAEVFLTGPLSLLR